MTRLRRLPLAAFGVGIGLIFGCAPTPRIAVQADQAAPQAPARYVIAFDADADVLPEDAAPDLDAAAVMALSGSTVELRIAGAIDVSRSLSYRAALSTHRATLIWIALEDRGVSRDLMNIDGACEVTGGPAQPPGPPRSARTVRIVISPPFPKDACGEM